MAVDVAERKGYDVLYTDDGSNGIDMIARDDDDKIIIIESKYNGPDDRVNPRRMDSEREGAKQMKNEWISNAFNGEIDAIESQLSDQELADVAGSIQNRDFEKEVIWVTPHKSSKTISDSDELLIGSIEQIS